MELFNGAINHTDDRDSSIDCGENNAEKSSSIEKLPRPLYHVQSPNDDTVLLGINVTIERHKVGEEKVTVVRWYDNSKERVMGASGTKQEHGVFTFKRSDDEGGGDYIFTPMNLEIYNNKVKECLIHGPDFMNEEDMIKAFLINEDFI